MINPSNPSEYEEQCALVEWLEIQKKSGKILNFSALPNNMFTRSWQQKVKQKKEGLRPGFPDLVILTKRKCLFIEMKRRKKGVVSPHQKKWHKDLESVGQIIRVCKGWDEARDFVNKYI